MITLAIISHVQHKRNAQGEIGGYAPYVREMNIWLKHADKIVVVAPVSDNEFQAIDTAYEHPNLKFIAVPAFSFTGAAEVLKALVRVPCVVFSIVRAMRLANHIHLRCPGNMGLLGSVIQVFFPKKAKTAKYAGNWDWNSSQPWSYRLQQRILQSTTLTRNMKVLVYGRWEGATKNIVPFFTASYRESEIIQTPVRALSGVIRLLFVGTLTANKRPMLCAETACRLKEKGYQVELIFLGEGPERPLLERYIVENGLEQVVYLWGNVDKNQVKERMQQAHFLIFASVSEGWPKAVAESMFWGCLPITTRVSCVAEMLDNGGRGALVSPAVEAVVERLEHYLHHPNAYFEQASRAMAWSRTYTLERFDNEIKMFLNGDH